MSDTITHEAARERIRELCRACDAPSSELMLLGYVAQQEHEERAYRMAAPPTFERLLELVRSLSEEQRHEVAKAAGVECWKPWHRQGFK